MQNRLENKILIAADCLVSDQFRGTISKELNLEIELLYFNSTVERRLKKLLRHLSYFLIAVRAFKKRNNYTGIIFWQQFIGIYYGLMCGFLNIKSCPPSVVFPLIYKKRKGILGRLQKGLFKLALKSKALCAFVCFSSSERAYYIEEFGSEFENKIVFKTLGIDIKDQEIKSPAQGNHYFFSGGTSNRDYRTLLKAFAGSRENLVVACLTKDIEGLKAPINVEIIHNSFDQDFLGRMKGAHGVIIPLDNPRISSGQLVLLTAMGLGKPIIITRGSCAEDYVSEDSALLVRDHSEEDIRQGVKTLLENRQKASLLAQNALSRYRENFTLQQFAKRIAEVLKTLEGKEGDV